MGRHSCCYKQKLRKGLWSPEEDEKLYDHIVKHGVGCWSAVPKQAGLQRCGKSCRLRWINYLRPDLKRGAFSPEEEDSIVRLHQALGNRWSQIAAQLPGRTDNEIKNFWNSCLKKKLRQQGVDPATHQPLSEPPPPPPAAAKSTNEPADGSASAERPPARPMFKFNPFPLLDIPGPTACNLGFYQQLLDTPSPAEQQGLFAGVPAFELGAMPGLGFLDYPPSESYGNTGETSSNSSNRSGGGGGGLGGNSAMMEDGLAFIWDSGRALESILAGQSAGEMSSQGPESSSSPWQRVQSSEDYSSFPATSLSGDLSEVCFDLYGETLDCELQGSFPSDS